VDLETNTPVSLLDAGLLADPCGGFARLSERGSVLRGHAMDGSPAWYVTGFNEVREVLVDRRFVADAAAVPGRDTDGVRDQMAAMLGIPTDLARYLTDTIHAADGADHLRLRKLASRAFTMRRIAQLRPRMEQIAADLLDGLTQPADLMTDYAYPLPVTVICELIGVPVEDQSTWLRWNMAIATLDPEAVPVAARAMIAYCHDLAARRRDEPADDLVSALVAAHDEDGDRLTETELVTLLITLVIAGHETTAHLIGNASVALLGHSEQLALLRSNPSLWPAAINELMRWCGPVTTTGLQYATEDVEVGGVLIRTGEAVQPVLAAGNLDAHEFACPVALDITRRPSTRGEGHVGFGSGPHYCLGAALARQEAEVALAALFTRFPGISLVEKPSWMPRPGMRWLSGLPVRLA
jgi:cytochrome P450